MTEVEHVTEASDMNPVRVRLRRDVVETSLARLNWTQSELAARARIRPTHLSDLLAGRKHPGPAVRKRLLSALGTTFDALFEVIAKTPNKT